MTANHEQSSDVQQQAEAISALDFVRLAEMSEALENRFRALAARGNRARGLTLLDQLDARSDA
jgi:hypothetical protein